MTKSSFQIISVVDENICHYRREGGGHQEIEGADIVFQADFYQ